jgi:hypothetical protein
MIRQYIPEAECAGAPPPAFWDDRHPVGHPFVAARDGKVYCLPCYARKWGRPVIDVAPLTPCQPPGRIGV